MPHMIRTEYHLTEEEVTDALAAYCESRFGPIRADRFDLTDGGGMQPKELPVLVAIVERAEVAK